MTTSTHYSALSDPDNVIIVSKESNWTDVKVYAKGSIQYKAEDAQELRKGKTIEVDGLGSLELYLGSDLEVRVNGIRYEASKTDSSEKVTNVSAIFWLLTIFSAIGMLFIFMASEMMDPTFFQILVGLQLFAVLVYGATAILLRRGIYWFYFVGAGTFTFFTLLQLLDIQAIMISALSIIIYLVRLVLLVLVLRILPTILKNMRSEKGTQKDDVILDQH